MKVCLELRSFTLMCSIGLSLAQLSLVHLVQTLWYHPKNMRGICPCPCSSLGNLLTVRQERNMLFWSDRSELVAVNMVLNVHRSHKAYRGWGEGEGYGGGGRGSYATLSPPEWLQHGSHLNISLIVRDKVTRLCPQTTTFLKRKESQSGIKLRPFCLPA